MEYSEDMLLKAGWDYSEVVVKDYTIHCIQVLVKLMVLTRSLVAAYGRISGRPIKW